MTDQVSEILEAGIKAYEIKYSGQYKELAELDFKILSDLALQNFKCIRSGECILLVDKPFYVVEWFDSYRPSCYHYSCITKENWSEEGSKAVVVIKSVDR